MLPFEDVPSCNGWATSKSMTDANNEVDSTSGANLLDQLRNGDSLAAERLWNQFFTRLVNLAEKQLAGNRIAIADQEDVAISALKSFCLGVQNGQFLDLSDRQSLWNLLAAIAKNKTLHLIRDQSRLKRGGNMNRIRTHPEGDGDDILVRELVSQEPTPQMAVEFAEECARLLSQLSKPELVEIATEKLRGCSNDELAKRMNKSERTIQRKLQLIRKIWLAAASE